MRISLLPLALLGVALAGCATPPTAVEADYGTSLQTLKALSRVNPAAPANPATPVEGGDIDMLNSGLENRRQSTEKDESTVEREIVINTGGGRGGRR